MKKNQFSPPQKIHSLMWAHTHTAVLKTAVELDVFTQIARGRTTVQGISRATGSSNRGIEMLLNALVGFQLLMKKGRKYGLTPESREFLVKESPFYLGKMILLIGGMASGSRISSRRTQGGAENLWRNLTRAVKTGKPVKMRSNQEERKKFWPILVEAIFPGSYIKARGLAQSWNPPRGKTPYRILDVAAGSAAWSIPFAERFQGVRVTALDYPEVLKATRKFARRLGVSSQYSYLPGDLDVLDFGREEYDLIILGNICHSLGARKSQKLIQKSFRALKKKSHLLIADTLPNEQRDGPLFPLLFALNMLLHSEEGDTFTLAEYKRWLTHAGFKGVKTLEIPPAPSPLIVARK